MDILVNILKTINIKANLEKTKKGDPTRVEIYSHQIFAAINEIVRNLDKMSFQ